MDPRKELATLKSAMAQIGRSADLVAVEFICGIVPIDRPSTSLLQAIAAITRSSPVYEYLRQTVRTMNAGPGITRNMVEFRGKMRRLEVCCQTVSIPVSGTKKPPVLRGFFVFTRNDHSGPPRPTQDRRSRARRRS